MSTEPESLISAEETSADEKKETSALKVITWFSVGMAVAAVGIFVGRELRSRYKFKRRTPYDFYSNAGEQPGEFGVGI
jgi:CRISPR/Cas system-associated protein Cas5 (RAMP superfamily)